MLASFKSRWSRDGMITCLGTNTRGYFSRATHIPNRHHLHAQTWSEIVIFSTGCGSTIIYCSAQSSRCRRMRRGLWSCCLISVVSASSRPSNPSSTMKSLAGSLLVGSTNPSPPAVAMVLGRSSSAGRSCSTMLSSDNLKWT